MNRPKLIRIHTIKGLKGLREDTLRPSFLFSARSILCSFLLFLACGLLLFAGATVVDAKIVCCIGNDIYVMNDDGSGRRRLTNNTQTADRDPRWSPDGKRIAFTRFMDKEQTQTSSELFVMNADGTDQKRLTHNTVADGYPSWSPDGQYLAFRSHHEVYVIELASQRVQRLTGTEGELGSTAPDWSPSGREIAYEKFISNGPGLAHKNIYLMRANGEQQHPLFPDPQEGADTIIMRFFPRWSADGQRILFNDCKWRGDEVKCHLTVQRIGGGKQEITAIKLLGKNWLTSIGGWMENDRAIIFGLKLTDTPNPNYNLYRYVFQTRSLRRLTRDARDEKQPDWIEGSLSVSPQGKLPTQWGDIKATGRAHLPSSPLR
jgi:tricorn protease-like protein